MELRPNGDDDFENGLGEVVSLESIYLYPMLKSSELMKPHPTPSRYMLVTQRLVGEDTPRIKREALGPGIISSRTQTVSTPAQAQSTGTVLDSPSSA